MCLVTELDQKIDRRWFLWDAGFLIVTQTLHYISCGSQAFFSSPHLAPQDELASTPGTGGNQPGSVQKWRSLINLLCLICLKGPIYKKVDFFFSVSLPSRLMMTLWDGGRSNLQSQSAVISPVEVQNWYNWWYSRSSSWSSDLTHALPVFLIKHELVEPLWFGCRHEAPSCDLTNSAASHC